ncbi:MFS transporter [Streptomyces sp. NBC_00464]|uniref:MFS transporter n=1 Tax=Streptomyces sp. NBC_00464 TaxID=2975751 RepID=UPI002E17153B
MSHSVPPSTGHRGALRPSALLTALLVSVGSYALMQTMIVPALPVLTRELDTDPSTAGWLITAFMLGSAVLTPVVGSLGDRYGHRRMMLVSLGVFLLSTLGAAFAPGVPFLIVMRAFEGISMATLPLALTLIREKMPPERTVSAFGLTSAMIGGGAGLGMVVGGLLIDSASWRWMFGVESVLIAIALLLVVVYVPETSRQRTGHTATPARLDLPGAILLAASMSALLLAVTQGSAWGWGSGRVIGLFVLAAVLLAALGTVETRRAAPLVDIRLLRHGPMFVTTVATLLIGAIPFLFYVLLPPLLQTPESAGAPYGHGLSVIEAGLLLLPGAIGTMIAGRLGPMLSHRFGARAPLFAAMALMAAGGVLMAVWHGSVLQIGVIFVLVGFGSGFGFAALASLVAKIVPRRDLAAGNSLNTVVRTIGSAIGSQLATVLLQSSIVSSTGLPTDDAFGQGFWLAGGLGVAGIVLTVALRVHPYESAGAPTGAVDTAKAGAV